MWCLSIECLTLWATDSFKKKVKILKLFTVFNFLNYPRFSGIPGMLYRVFSWIAIISVTLSPSTKFDTQNCRKINYSNSKPYYFYQKSTTSCVYNTFYYYLAWVSWVPVVDWIKEKSFQNIIIIISYHHSKYGKINHQRRKTNPIKRK